MRILFTITLLIACVTFTFAQTETAKTKKTKKAKKEITTTPFQDEGWQAKGVQGVDNLTIGGKEFKEANKSMFVPLSFNPNGAAQNIEFKVIGKDIAVMEMHIFNQEGELIHSSKLKDSWNGRTLTGEKAPEGDYIYLIKARITPGKTTKASGVVSLKR